MYVLIHHQGIKLTGFLTEVTKSVKDTSDSASSHPACISVQCIALEPGLDKNFLLLWNGSTNTVFILLWL